MRSASKIETEMDIIRHRGLDSRPSEVSERWPAARADHEIQTHQSYYQDNDCAGKEVLFLHLKNRDLTGLLPFVIDVGDGRPRDFENRLIGAPDLETGFAHGCDHADNAARRDYLVASFKTRNRLLQLSLSLLLGPY